MSETPVETEVTLGSNSGVLQPSLATLWRKVRDVSELVLRLKQENRDIKKQLNDHTLHERDLKQQIEILKAELEQTRVEVHKHQSNGSSVFTTEEKEALVLRIKELLAKLTSRL